MSISNQLMSPVHIDAGVHTCTVFIVNCESISSGLPVHFIVGDNGLSHATRKHLTSSIINLIHPETIGVHFEATTNISQND